MILSSRDGYCTLVVFDEILPAHYTQQHTLQLQSIAHHNSVPISYATPNTASGSYHNQSAAATPAVTPSMTNVSLPFVLTPTVPKKRSEPPLTPAASIEGDRDRDQAYSSSASTLQGASASRQSGEKGDKEEKSDTIQEPPKKKRRVALTKVADLES